MSENTTKFLVTMPVEVKEAARSLLRLYQNTPERESPDSLNEMFVGMIEASLEDVREKIESFEYDEQKLDGHVVGIQKIMAFIVAHPERTNCKISDVLHSDEAIKYILDTNDAPMMKDESGKIDNRLHWMNVPYHIVTQHYVYECEKSKIRKESIESLKAYFAAIDEAEFIAREERLRDARDSWENGNRLI